MSDFIYIPPQTPLTELTASDLLDIVKGLTCKGREGEREWSGRGGKGREGVRMVGGDAEAREKCEA